MKFTVVRTQRVKSPDLARAGKDDILVLYRNEAQELDTITLPFETFSDQTLILAVRQHEERKTQLLGRTFET